MRTYPDETSFLHGGFEINLVDINILQGNNTIHKSLPFNTTFIFLYW